MDDLRIAKYDFNIFLCVFLGKTYTVGCWVSSLQSVSVPTIGGKNPKALKQRNCHP